MRKNKKPKSKNEKAMSILKVRLMCEKGYTEKTSLWLIGRLNLLIDHLHYGHAVIAFSKQNGSFCLTTATLIYYEGAFHKKHDRAAIDGPIVFWDVDQRGWRTFQAINFLEWRPVV